MRLCLKRGRTYRLCTRCFRKSCFCKEALNLCIRKYRQGQVWWLTPHQKYKRGGGKKKVKMEREQGKSKETRKTGRRQGEAQRRKDREGVVVDISDPINQEAEESGISVNMRPPWST